jgi:hypothetical protein
MSLSDARQAIRYADYQRDGVVGMTIDELGAYEDWLTRGRLEPPTCQCGSTYPEPHTTQCAGWRRHHCESCDRPIAGDVLDGGPCFDCATQDLNDGGHA